MYFSSQVAVYILHVNPKIQNKGIHEWCCGPRRAGLFRSPADHGYFAMDYIIFYIKIIYKQPMNFQITTDQDSGKGPDMYY